jgi:hypothetical protein
MIPALFAAAFVTLSPAHYFADHWLQSDHQAVTKGLPGWPGRLACARHATVVTATLALALAVTAAATGARFSLPWTVFALTVNGSSHYWADRRTTLASLAALTGKGALWRIGLPRDGRDDNACLGTGAYALDQSWHVFWLLVTALVIAAGSR